MIESSLLFKKNTSFTGTSQTREFLGLEMQNFQVLFLYGAEHIAEFSNLYWCTFNGR